MEGTNLEIYQMINQIAGIQVIASGGISFEEEIIALRDMNLYAAIVGKAVYEGALDLERVIPLAEQETGAF